MPNLEESIPANSGPVIPADPENGIDSTSQKHRSNHSQYRANETWYQRLLDNLPGLIYQFCITAQGEAYFLYVSGASSQFLGESPDAIVNKSLKFDTLIHPDDLASFQQSIFESMQALHPWQAEWRQFKPTGEMIWVQGQAVPARQADGSTIWDGILMEIPARQKIEAALEASEKRFRDVVEAAGEYIWEIDTDLNFTFSSDRVMQVLGYEPEAILGKNFLEIAQAKYHSEITQVIERSKQQRSTFSLECLCHHANGNNVWVQVSGLPMFNQQEQCVGFRGATLDVTERRMTQIALEQSFTEMEVALQEMQEMQLQLVQSEKMSSLGQLVAGVAHEINNPTSFIYGNLDHARRYMEDLLDLVCLYQQEYPQLNLSIEQRMQAIDWDFLKIDFPKVLSSMKVGAERIQAIVLALRNFSRMDESEIKEVDLHDGIDSTLMILKHRLRRNNGMGEILITQNYGDIPTISCHAGQLNQVFMNILANAIDALDERDAHRSIEAQRNLPSQITISTQLIQSPISRLRSAGKSSAQQPAAQNATIQIRIRDNGTGIAPDIQSQLFNPFFTTKPVGKGTGMGLAISYQVIVEKHNGQIFCHSTLGEGTEFVIELPIE